MASSNTVLSPFCVRAEHSRYFTAPTSLAIAFSKLAGLTREKQIRNTSVCG